MRAANTRCVTVMLTAFPDVDSAIEGIHHHVDDYIIKPTRPDVLVALLAEKLISRHKDGGKSETSAATSS
jgi:DNA-binding response OmpR family regulator